MERKTHAQSIPPEPSKEVAQALDGEPLLRCHEAARLLGCAVGTIHAMVSQGRLPVVDIGPRFKRFRRSDLLAFVASRVRPARDRPH